MFSVTPATYSPAASVVRPPATSQPALAHVSSVRQTSTQVPHQGPHTQRVGECGQGQEEWVCEEAGGSGLLLGWASRESEPTSIVTSPFVLLESRADFRGRLAQYLV